MTSADDDGAETGDDASRRGSIERQSPQSGVLEATTSVVASLVQHDIPPARRPEPTDDADTASDVDMEASSPEPAGASEDGRRSAGDLRSAVEASPPPLPSPPSLTAAVDDEEKDDEDVAASLVITDVAKYVSKLDVAQTLNVLFALLGRIAVLPIRRCDLLLQTEKRGMSVCRSVCHDCEPCKNG